MKQSSTNRPRESSRNRFDTYKTKSQNGELPRGSMHATAPERSHKERIRSAKELLRRFFQLLAPFRWQIVWILASLTVATVLALIPPAGTKFLVDYVLTQKPLPEPWATRFPSLTDPKTLLMATVIAVVSISLLKIVVHILGRWYATRITKHIQLNVRRKVFEHAVRLPLHRVHEIRSGGVASILREDGGSVGELVFGLLYNPWRAIIQLLGSFIILAWVDWTLLLGAAVLLPLVFLSHKAWISKIRPQFRAIRKQREQIDAGAAEAFSGIRVVRAFSRQKRESGRFVTENNLMVRQELYAWWWMRAVEMIWEAMIPLSSAALLFYGGWRVLEGALTVGDLMMFLVYLLMLLQPLATLANSATQFQNSLSGLDRILDLLDEPKEMESTPESIRVSRNEVAGNIAFNGVTFAYPGTETAALNSVNLQVKAGQVIALVGPSGAGKTTLLRILAGVDTPDTGVVEAGHGLRVGYYAQEHETLDIKRTVLENMLSSSPSIGETEARNVLGSFLFSGDDVHKPAGVLSGGEKTRLSLATLVVSKANVLLLDEPTNNLDPASREEILDALAHFSGAVVLVSHDDGAVLALNPERVVIMPDGVEDHWSEEYQELIALA